MNNKTIRILKEAALQYETKDFLLKDPALFMHIPKEKHDKEVMAFIASCMSYGRRELFFPKIQYILDCSRGEPYQWVRTGRFALDIPDDNNCFYRLYTNHMMYGLFQALQSMYEEHGDMESYIRSYAKKYDEMEEIDALTAIDAICQYFQKHEITGIVPKNTNSCCKRICMFLRWMVRKGSPVDIGIWSELINQRTLIMPLDTHVIQQAMQLGLLKSKSATMVAARRLTEELATFFLEDPLKADFALFGYGVNL